MSVDVATVVDGLLSGSIPPQAGLATLLIKGRENSAEIVSHVPYLITRLLDDRENGLIATNLEILATLLASEYDDEVVSALVDDIPLSRLLHHLSNHDFSVRYPLLRIFITIAKLKRPLLQRYLDIFQTFVKYTKSLAI